MGKASMEYKRIYFFIEDEVTECYVFLEAHGDCPIGVQGWRHKTFGKSVPVIKIVEEYAKDCVMWDMGAPPVQDIR